MAELHYCWRCRMEHYFFDEGEWEEISPLFVPGILALNAYCNENRMSLDKAIEENKEKLPVFLKYKELTGEENTCINSMWHHRRSNFGSLCPKCSKLLRTPKAKFCAECGYSVRDQG